MQDTQLKQEMEETCVLALEPQVQDFNEQGKEASLAIVSLLQKLEQLEQAGARSVALEMESVVDEQRTLVDYLGRAKILQLCRDVHETCKQLSGPEQRSRLEMELRDAVMGKSRWLHRADEAQEADVQADSAASPHLLLARGKKPLSLWDWKIWTMAKPRLWRHGDAGNLYEREGLSTSERAACLLLREELTEYAVPAVADTSSVSVSREPAWRGEEQVVDYKTPAHNRFSGDWVALHMFATVARLTEQRAASYNFLRNGGMAFAKSIEKLTAEDLAMAARNMSGAVRQAVQRLLCQQLYHQGWPRARRHARSAEQRRGWTVSTEWIYACLELALSVVFCVFFGFFSVVSSGLQNRLCCYRPPLAEGIQRLEAERQEREQAQVTETADACAAGQPAPGRRAALFGETMKTLTRLSSSYRRCHWKSAAEVIFPLLFQHLTYASHRTWKLYVKKAVFFCLEAWRRKYGDSVLRRAPAEATSSEPVIFCREGLDDLLLRGWRKVSRKDESTGEMLTLFVGPEGQVCHDVQRLRKLPQQKLSLIQQLLQSDTSADTVEAAVEDSGRSTNLRALQENGQDEPVLGSATAQRAKYLSVSTSSLEDYMYCGDHPILAEMSWSTYGMWVYRVELPPGQNVSVRAAVPRHMDIYFSSAYKLYNSHAQRISTEPRVPMFEGFTMPPLTIDSERNAMHKQVQCRPFAISDEHAAEDSPDQQVVRAFASFCKSSKEKEKRTREKRRTRQCKLQETASETKDEAKQQQETAREKDK